MSDLARSRRYDATPQYKENRSMPNRTFSPEPSSSRSTKAVLSSIGPVVLSSIVVFVPTFRAEIMGQLVSLAVTGTSPEEDVRDGGTTSTRSLTPKLREDVSTRTVPTARHAQGDQEQEVPPSEDQYPLSGVHATEGGRGESRNDVHESAGVDRFA